MPKAHRALSPQLVLGPETREGGRRGGAPTHALRPGRAVGSRSPRPRGTWDSAFQGIPASPQQGMADSTQGSVSPPPGPQNPLKGQEAPVRSGRDGRQAVAHTRGCCGGRGPLSCCGISPRPERQHPWEVSVPAQLPRVDAHPRPDPASWPPSVDIHTEPDPASWSGLLPSRSDLLNRHAFQNLLPFPITLEESPLPFSRPVVYVNKVVN